MGEASLVWKYAACERNWKCAECEREIPAITSALDWPILCYRVEWEKDPKYVTTTPVGRVDLSNTQYLSSLAAAAAVAVAVAVVAVGYGTSRRVLGAKGWRKLQHSRGGQRHVVVLNIRVQAETKQKYRDNTKSVLGVQKRE